MDIRILTKSIRERAAKRTPEESRSLLIKAHILDESGNLDARFFTLPNLNNTSNQEKGMKEATYQD